jgi:uncharacterized protein
MSEAVQKHPLIAAGWLRVLIFSFLYIVSVFLVYTAEAEIVTSNGMASANGKQADPELLLNGDLLWLTVLAGSVLAFLLVYILRRFIDRDSFSSLGFSTEGWGSDAITGFFLAPAILGTGSLILFLTGNLKWMDIDFDAGNLFISLGIFILVAFSEELIFRGYILNNLMCSFNRWVALVISALLFALAHLNAESLNFLPLANLFIGGLLLGINYIYTKNIWFAICLHLSWNFFQGPLLGFKVSSQSIHSLLQTELKGSPLLTGGGFGFEGSFIATALTLTAFLILYLTYKRKYREIPLANSN